MRLTQLEALELEKLEQETRLKEELMSNHGKQRDFFKGPNLHKNKKEDIEDDELLELQY